MKQRQYFIFIDWNSFLCSSWFRKSGSLTLSDLYNVLTIHGVAEQATLPSSVLDIQQFWKTTGYNVGGLVYSLDDIEHGILRGEGSGGKMYSLDHFEDDILRGEFLSCRGRGLGVRCIVWTTLRTVS